ncbi:hypothetical protein SAMN05443429_103130 [Cruoricaptor ignavus]|uniref:Uncharacterized protein n=1 Tax=Cruoricaptor ignavus TaxID=1118202 RepID=A0A1M6D6K9_9FLAO|nr:hypothetical protein [Cruoricaptor ignavus]SHI68638.1 hypothetical protein SAMN05443429_103130 [Cruoricaptor ignavus]
MTDIFVLEDSSDEKVKLLLRKAKEAGLALKIQKRIPKEITRELSEKEEKEAFLYTSKVNLSKIIDRYI